MTFEDARTYAKWIAEAYVKNNVPKSTHVAYEGNGQYMPITTSDLDGPYSVDEIVETVYDYNTSD